MLRTTGVQISPSALCGAGGPACASGEGGLEIRYDPRPLAVYATIFIGPVSINAVLPLLGAIADAFEATTEQILLTIPALMLPFAAIQFFSGAISDLLDRRVLIIIGLALFAAGSWAFAFAPSFLLALVARVLQGGGFGLVAPVLVAILGDIVPLQKRAQALGFFGSALTAGAALGPLLAAAFGEAHWRTPFVVLGFLAMGALAGFAAAFRKPVGGTYSEARGATVIRLLLTTAVQREVVLLCAMGFGTLLASVGILALTSAAFSEAPFNYSPGLIGAILSVSGLAGMVSAPIAGGVTRLLGPRKVTMFGALGSAASALLLAETDNAGGFILLFASLGVFLTFLWTPLLTLVTTVIPERRGTVSSLFNGTRFVGFSLAPVLWPLVLPAPVWAWTGRAAALLFLGGFLASIWLPASLSDDPPAEPLKGS